MAGEGLTSGSDGFSDCFSDTELELVVRCGGVGGLIVSFSSFGMDFVVLTGIGGAFSTAALMSWTTFFVDSFGSTGGGGGMGADGDGGVGSLGVFGVGFDFET